MAVSIFQVAKVKARLNQYVPGEDFEIYLDLVEKFFVLVLNKIDDVEKVRQLIGHIGTAANTKILKALKPKKIADATYDEIIKLCKTLFVQSQKSIVMHCKLLKRDQHEGESLRDYAIELQTLGKHCKYNATSLDLLMRDKFICGLQNESTRTKLMETDDDKKFSEVVEMAERFEHIKNEYNAF